MMIDIELQCSIIQWSNSDTGELYYYHIILQFNLKTTNCNGIYHYVFQTWPEVRNHST